MPDPTEDVREQLHDAVDEAVDDANRERTIDERFASLERMILDRPTPAPVDMSGLEASIAALGSSLDERLTRLEASGTRAPAPEPDKGGDAGDAVEDAAEDVQDAVEDATDPKSLDERIAAAGNVKVDLPEIPERPPIRAISHPIFRKLWGK